MSAAAATLFVRLRVGLPQNMPDECLTENWLVAMGDVRARLKARIVNEEVPPHSGLDNLTPS